MLLAPALSACGSSSTTTRASAGAARTLTDTVGRTVKVPATIRRVATVGYTTTLDSLLYVVGAQDMLVDGIPSASSSTFLRPYRDLAPRLLQLPKVESTINGPVNGEALLTLKPDVVIASDPAKAEQVQKLGIPAVVVFDLGTGSAIEHDVNLVGQLLSKGQAAAAYTGYFDNIIRQARQRSVRVPASARPSALYADFGPLTQPTVVEGWIFGVLGVRTVVPGRVPNHFAFSDEQVYRWNPDYIVVQMPSDLSQFTKSPQFRPLGAVRAGRVKVIPSGFNIWGDNTVEEPLGLLWTGQYIYPRQFGNVDLARSTESFYARFFHVTLTPAQVSRLLNAGGLR